MKSLKNLLLYSFLFLSFADILYTKDSSYSYCGASSNLIPILENPNLKLSMVQLITRHGDRLPNSLVSPDPKFRIYWNNCATEYGTTKQSNFIFTKNYLVDISLQNNSTLLGLCDFNLLTTKGAEQLKSVGNSIRNTYIEKYGYLSSNPQNFSDQIWVRSSDFEKTLNSAYHLLAGLYPTNSTTNRIEIPIHMLPSELENLYPNTKVCPRINTFENEIKNMSEYKIYFSKLNNLENELKQTLKWPSISWSQLEDPLICRVCSERDLPPGITLEMEQQVFDAALFEGNFYMSFKEGLALYTGPFLNELKMNIEKRMHAVNMPRLMYFSAHDITISPIITALGFPQSLEWPPYASVLVLETWQRMSDAAYLIRFVYNGEQINLKACTQDSGLCSFEEFENLIQGIAMDNNQYKIFCNQN